MEAAAELGDAGDFVLTEVDVDSDGDEARAAMARRAGKAPAKAPGGKAPKARVPEPPAGGKAPKARKAAK